MLTFSYSYLQLPPSLHSRTQPNGAPDPKLVLLNGPLAKDIGFDPDRYSGAEWAELLTGAQLPADASPFAQAYAGHQFGHFANLGDGRAIMLGELHTPDGRILDLQLKGAGRTRYSRRGDGKAALGPMLREYIVSEAMHALGVPTTRSLAVVTTGEPVYRETILQGAVLARIASSHLRVGTFEYAAAIREPETLAALVDFAIARHGVVTSKHEPPALTLLDHVIKRQIALVVEWMRVGFIHGVMNTDNMTISGETIDYGPCAFMDEYQSLRTFSSIDKGKRYAFAQQPLVAQWNLARFAEALLPLLGADEESALETAQARIAAIGGQFQSAWLNMMGRKLGLQEMTENDRPLADDLLSWMQDTQADYTNTFARLGATIRGDSVDADDEIFSAWLRRWRQRLEAQAGGLTAALQTMSLANPVRIPRNHLVEAAISAANDANMEPLHDLLKALEQPYGHNDTLPALQRLPTESERVRATFCGT
jgi:uncharacterized protein YdiU (UPF0061 family)